MGKILFIVIMVALTAAFVILLIKKLGWAEWMQIHGDKYLSKLFSCDLCMSFWAAMVICLVMCCWEDKMLYLFLPMFTTPISRMLV
jgi:hypothetical protein